LLLLAVCLLQVMVMTHLILRSRWTGWRLVAATFFIFYGVTTFMPQIESAVFLTHLPRGTVPRLFLMGALIAAPFSVLAVLILGKRKAVPRDTDGDTQLAMPASEWVWKLTVIAVVYVILYFTFGYFVAWKNPAVRAYYGGSDPAGFISHITSLVRQEPLLFLLQALRALLWTAIAAPVIKMMKGEWWESGLAVALLFAVMTSQLLLPNPLMPPEVRMVHLTETATSNFLFGWLVVLILRRHTALPQKSGIALGSGQYRER